MKNKNKIKKIYEKEKSVHKKKNNKIVHNIYNIKMMKKFSILYIK